MAFDATDIAQLEAIAQAVEEKAGTDPGALRRDATTVSKLKRIADSISGFVTSVETHSLPAHEDVLTTMTPSDGDFLRYNNSITAWEAQTAALDDLTDISLSAPGSAEFLRHDGTDWKNAALVLGDLPSIALNDLSDVSAGSPATFDRIYWNGSTWTKGREKFFQHADSAGSGTPVNGDMVYHDGSKWTNIGGNLLNNLLRRDGSLALTNNWNAGNFTITAKKWLAENTTENTSFDTTDFGLNVTLTGVDIGTTYRSVYVDQDYDIDGNISSSNVRGVHVDQNTLNTSGGGVYAVNASAFSAEIGLRGETAPSLQSGDVGLNIAVQSNTTNNVYGAYTLGVNASTGQGIGYQGYGNNTSAGTAYNAIGVFGFAQSSNGLMAGVQALSFSTNTRGFAFYTQQGHNHLSGGVTYIYTNTALQAAATTTHITPGTDNGSLWIEKYLEVDNTAFFDGGATLADQTILQLGTYTNAQRPAAGTAGRIIFNTDDGQLNIDDGTNWTLPDGTTT